MSPYSLYRRLFKCPTWAGGKHRRTVTGIQRLFPLHPNGETSAMHDQLKCRDCGDVYWQTCLDMPLFKVTHLKPHKAA